MSTVKFLDRKKFSAFVQSFASARNEIYNKNSLDWYKLLVGLIKSL